MINLRNKEDNKVRLIYITSAVYVFFHYALGYRPIYQPDIYMRVTASLRDLAAYSINRDGRILTEITVLFLRAVSGNYQIFYYISVILSSLLVCLSIVKYSKLVTGELGTRKELTTWQTIVITLLSCITIANLFSAEYFLYDNMTVCFSLAILFSVDAAICYIRFMDDGKKGFLLRCGIELLIVVFYYEPIASIFIILTLPIILIRIAAFVDFLKKQLLTGVLYGSAILVKYLFTNYIIKSDRTGFDQNTVLEMVSVHVSEEKPVVQLIFERITFGMWGYAIIFAVILFLVIYQTVAKRKTIEIVKTVYLVAIILFLGFLPFILRLSDDYKPRLYYPAGFVLGIICIYAILNDTIDIELGSRVSKTWMVLIGTMVVIQWISFVQMYVDAYVTNYEDEYISKMIGEEIQKYEHDNKRSVEKVVFYEDANRTKYSRIGWCIIQRAYSSWGNLFALNYYLDKQYEQGAADQEIADFFSTQDWDVFSEEQVIFRDDTAHICMY